MSEDILATVLYSDQECDFGKAFASANQAENLDFPWHELREPIRW
jgi:hypothetical protein